MKAYDKVAWDILFCTMIELGMPQSFVDRVTLFFRDVGVVVNLNNQVQSTLYKCYTYKC